MFKIFACIFFWNICASTYGAEAYLAIPPSGWECLNDTSQLPQKVKIIYVGKGTSNNPFTPSINVACENTALPVEEYVKTAKFYHEGQRDTHCTLLGKLKTAAGEAELLQIDRPSQWGNIRFIQAILIKEENAYVVTATCLKDDFRALSTQIFKAIHSLTVR